VDYLGVFDDVAKSLEFDEEGFRKVIDNIASIKDKLPGAMQKCLGYFAGVDRTVGGYEGLIAAQDCLPNNKTRDAFAADYSYLSKIWEALSPDPMLVPYKTDYKWLSQVYESVKPSTGDGALIWHALGALAPITPRQLSRVNIRPLVGPICRARNPQGNVWIHGLRVCAGGDGSRDGVCRGDGQRCRTRWIFVPNPGSICGSRE
jgi:hypothetical protein